MVFLPYSQHWGMLTSVLAAIIGITAADTTQYSACQYPNTNPRQGCDSKTILVSKTYPTANFTTIQAAILSLPKDNSSQTILVMSGNYTEQLNITRPGPVTILGQTSLPHQQANNTVNVFWAAANANSKFADNAFTSVLTVAPNLNASLTGSGTTGFAVPANTPFGCIDFRVYNIDFRNNWTQYAAGPALAVSVSRANAGFYHSGFFSYQDTVYIGKLGNAYFYRNTIAGQTDFLYGFGTAWFEQTLLQLRGCGGGIIAWKGTNTTFPNKYGAYVSNSTISAANSTIATKLTGKCWLGRPWNAQHRSVYINTYMDASIQGAGYEKWSTSSDVSSNHYNNYTIMAEYASSGPGFNLSKRLAGNLTIEFTAVQVAAYKSPKDVFMKADGSQPDVAWIDADSIV